MQVIKGHQIETEVSLYVHFNMKLIDPVEWGLGQIKFVAGTRVHHIPSLLG